MVRTLDNTASPLEKLTISLSPRSASTRYWVNSWLLSHEDGSYPLQRLSTALSNVYRYCNVPRRWSNQLGGWEYALMPDEIRKFFFRPGAFHDSLLDRVPPLEQIDEREHPHDITYREAWHWITLKTFSGWEGTYPHLHIYRNLHHAVEEERAATRDMFYGRQFLVRTSYIPELAFKEPTFFTPEALKERTRREALYALRLQRVVS